MLRYMIILLFLISVTSSLELYKFNPFTLTTLTFYGPNISHITVPTVSMIEKEAIDSSVVDTYYCNSIDDKWYALQYGTRFTLAKCNNRNGFIICDSDKNCVLMLQYTKKNLLTIKASYLYTFFISVIGPLIVLYHF